MSVDFDLEEGFEQPERPVVDDPVRYVLIPLGGVRWEFPAGRVEPPDDDEAA